MRERWPQAELGEQGGGCPCQRGAPPAREETGTWRCMTRGPADAAAAAVSVVSTTQLENPNINDTCQLNPASPRVPVSLTLKLSGEPLPHLLGFGAASRPLDTGPCCRPKNSLQRARPHPPPWHAATVMAMACPRRRRPWPWDWPCLSRSSSCSSRASSITLGFVSESAYWCAQSLHLIAASQLRLHSLLAAPEIETARHTQRVVAAIAGCLSRAP